MNCYGATALALVQGNLEDVSLVGAALDSHATERSVHESHIIDRLIPVAPSSVTLRSICADLWLKTSSSFLAQML